MKSAKLLLSGFAASAFLGLSPSVLAEGREPGSLLIFPEFDNRAGDVTMFTVTNTNTDDTYDEDTDLPVGTIEVHFIYIGRRDANGNPINCLEVDRDIVLTPGDTFTFLTRAHNPQQNQGFMYAYAQDPRTHEPVRFNWLIGNALFISGIDAIDYSTNPVSLEGLCENHDQTGGLGGAPGECETTDHDGDGNRDLDGREYEELPDKILIPRFLAKTAALRSELVFLGLSGGAAFDTVANLLIYNDNEEVFSAQYQFRCWARVGLDDVSQAFTNSFLQTTNHAANEPLGATSRESGWTEIDGDVAFSTVEQILDPAVYAVLIERVTRGSGAADLPFECGRQCNGTLWPNGPLGDDGLDGDECGVAVR